MEEYLPKQMSEEEIKAELTKIIASVGASGAGGSSTNAGVLGGALAALTAALVLLLLLLMRRAAAKPIWRSYLPEVPPA